MEQEEFAKLSWREHIRMRPGMFIGNLKFYGFRQIIKYLLEELIQYAGEHAEIELQLLPDSKIKIIGKNFNSSALFLRMKNLDAVGYSNKELGFPVLTALCPDFKININSTERSFIFSHKSFSEENLMNEKIEFIEFKFSPDKTIFQNLILSFEQLNLFISEFAFLTTNLKFIVSDASNEEPQRNVYHFPEGIFSKMDEAVHLLDWPASDITVKANHNLGDCVCKICIYLSRGSRKNAPIRTFANYEECTEGGALREGILQGVKSFILKEAKKEEVAISFRQNNLSEEIMAYAHIIGENVIFEGSTRTKLGMPEVKKRVAELVEEKLSEFYKRNPEKAKEIVRRFEKWNF